MSIHYPEWDWAAAFADAEAHGDERPTWAYDWPAGKRLTEDIVEPEFPERLPERCCDLGCGRGALGLHLLATFPDMQVQFADGSAEVLAFVAATVALNDWSDRAIISQHKWGDPLPHGPWPCIIGGDILYRPECFSALMQTLSASLSAEGFALLSDPRRKLEPELAQRAREQALSWTISRPQDRYTLAKVTRLA